MIKKIIPVVIIILLFFIGFLAVTQEDDTSVDIISSGFDDESFFIEEDNEHLDIYASDEMNEDDLLVHVTERRIPSWVKPVRWFRSNKGGMALEEVQSQYAAMRNQYALAIDFIEQDDLPEYLFSHYDNSYYIEIRMLYERGEQIRAQYIFRDFSGTTRLNSVIIENRNNKEEKTENVDIVLEESDLIEISTEEQEPKEEHAIEDTTIEIAVEIDKPKQYSGFIEVFNENAFLTSEYRFFEDGRKSKADFTLNNGIMINSLVWEWEEDEEGGSYREVYADYFRYNRAMYLRAVERKFFSNEQTTSLDNLLVTFPYRILEASQGGVFISERLNLYPEFFGPVIANNDYKIIFSTDERGRIMNQTLYDKNNEIIWVIVNKWIDERIESMIKTEGETELLAEFEYGKDGNIAVERNYRNGKLERRVLTEGKVDTEELYFNDIVVMRAVWEDGRKISETRGRH